MQKRIKSLTSRILNSFLLGIAFAAGFSSGVALLAEVPKFYGSDRIDVNNLNRMVERINGLTKQISGMEAKEKALEEKVKSLEKRTSDYTGIHPMWENSGSSIKSRNSATIEGDIFVESPGSRRKL